MWRGGWDEGEGVWVESIKCSLQEWEEREDEDVIVIERILLLIRNLLHIAPDSQEEKVR